VATRVKNQWLNALLETPSLLPQQPTGYTKTIRALPPPTKTATLQKGYVMPSYQWKDPKHPFCDHMLDCFTEVVQSSITQAGFRLLFPHKGKGILASIPGE
jgi:hypothetical protein